MKFKIPKFIKSEVFWLSIVATIYLVSSLRAIIVGDTEASIVFGVLSVFNFLGAETMHIISNFAIGGE